MKKHLLAMTVACLAVTPGAYAHDGATGVVKERMDHMKVMGDAMKALAKYVQGAEPFDGADVAKLATAIGERGGRNLVGLFPEGSLDHPTAARPEIWQRWDRFEALADEMQVQAETLVQTASGAPTIRPPMGMSGMGGGSMLGGGQNGMMGGPANMPPDMAVRMNFMHLSSACKNCHTEFRIKKN